ncbi:PTS sugar transporter subunit IIC [Candidatus Latescibacterota bacterium]
MEIYAVILIAAGFIAMDTTGGPQVLISEPVVACSMLGLLFGKPEVGIGIGVLFQLLWLGYMPLGATRLIDGNMAAFVSTASMFAASRIYGLGDVFMKAAIIPAMLYGVVVGIIGLHLTQIVRKMNGRRNESLQSRLKAGENASLAKIHITGLCSSFFRGLLMALVFVPAGAVLFGNLRFLTPQMTGILSHASLFIWGTVSASAIVFFRFQDKLRYIVLGMIGGMIWTLVLIR